MDFMMTSLNGNIFRVTGPLCGEFTGHKSQWRGALMLSLICAWINGWVNNHEAGDLRRHHAHYDVTVMIWCRRATTANTETEMLSFWQISGQPAMKISSKWHFRFGKNLHDSLLKTHFKKRISYILLYPSHAWWFMLSCYQRFAWFIMS